MRKRRRKMSLAGLLPVLRDRLGFNVSGIHPRLARPLYRKDATVRKCDGSCCLGGTSVSVHERDRILRHAGIVSAEMTSSARRDASRWFGARTTKDEDFTAGRATFTRVADGGCVFLRNDRLCALQVAGDRNLGNPYALKPAVCILWPLCVQDRTLEAGYAWFTRRRECCAPVRDAARTILQVMAPDEKLIRNISRPGASHGGGPPRPAGG
ncbi:MAG TPA: DUF3109 family protein [Candidatus Polarisedimenticolia bacterium]|nr:DUF3109 family protein [Candidatus Polarisedimenticolia bacterium]